MGDPANILGIFNFEGDFENAAASATVRRFEPTDPAPTFLSTPVFGQGGKCLSGFSAGVFADGNAAMRVAFSSLANLTVEFDIYPTNLSATSVMLGYTSAGQYEAWMGVTSDGRAAWLVGGSLLQSDPGVIQINTSYIVAFVTTGSTNRKIYVNNALVAENTSTGSIAGCNTLRIGHYTIGAEYFRGHINQVVFSNVARTSFPTIDPHNDTLSTSATGPRTINLAWHEDPYTNIDFALIRHNTVDDLATSSYIGASDTINFDHESLDPETTHYYWVEFYGPAGYLGTSVSANATTPALGLPTGLAVAAESTISLHATWNAPATPPDYILIFVDGDLHTVVAGTAVESFILGLLPSTTYQVKLRAVADGAESGFTSEVPGTTEAGEVPVGPTNFTATKDGEHAIDLDWIVGSGTFLVRVHRNTSNNFASSGIVAIRSATQPSWKDTGRDAGTLYYYWLVAESTDHFEGSTIGPANATTDVADSGWQVEALEALREVLQAEMVSGQALDYFKTLVFGSEAAGQIETPALVVSLDDPAYGPEERVGSSSMMQGVLHVMIGILLEKGDVNHPYGYRSGAVDYQGVLVAARDVMNRIEANRDSILVAGAGKVLDMFYSVKSAGPSADVVDKWAASIKLEIRGRFLMSQR